MRETKYGVRFDPEAEFRRYTLLWKDGTSEVIGARDNEDFSSAFVRRFGVLALESLKRFVVGSRLSDFEFDAKNKTWIEIDCSNPVDRIINLVKVCNYQVAV